MEPDLASQPVSLAHLGHDSSRERKELSLGERIKAGTVYVNKATNCWEELAPFGGIKKSGLGRMLSTSTLDELTETKLMLVWPVKSEKVRLFLHPGFHFRPEELK